MSLVYKFIEISTVTDEEIERVVNEWVGKGWDFEGIHFVVREASRRPSMAFISLTRGESVAVTETETVTVAETVTVDRDRGP